MRALTRLRWRSSSPLGAMHTHASNLSSLCMMLFLACRAGAPPPASDFRDGWLGLFRAVTRSSGARTYYVGSDAHGAYFETKFEDSLVVPTYRKVEASRMHLPRTFPLGQGKPHRIEVSNFAGYEGVGLPTSRGALGVHVAGEASSRAGIKWPP